MDEIWQQKLNLALELYKHEDTTRWNKVNAQAALNTIFFTALVLGVFSPPDDSGTLRTYYLVLALGSMAATILNLFYTVAVHRSVQYIRGQFKELQSIADQCGEAGRGYFEPGKIWGCLSSHLMIICIAWMWLVIWLFVASGIWYYRLAYL